MSSIRRTLSSRTNGALSKGPKTEQGKRRAALANMRHGLLSKCVVIENESKELFDLVLEQHIANFKPLNFVEEGMVEDIACAYWRLRRVMAIETRMLNKGVRGHDDVDELDRLEQGFAGLSETSKFNVLNRYEARLQRTYQRALRNLATLREGPLSCRKKQKLPSVPLN
jgi:hypothetical protein